MEEKDIIRCLESIVETAKVLARADDTVVTPWARQILVCAHTALEAKSPEAGIGDLIEYE